jgi:hypothetical protein
MADFTHNQKAITFDQTKTVIERPGTMRVLVDKVGIVLGDSKYKELALKNYVDSADAKIVADQKIVNDAQAETNEDFEARLKALETASADHETRIKALETPEG